MTSRSCFLDLGLTSFVCVPHWRISVCCCHEAPPRNRCLCVMHPVDAAAVSITVMRLVRCLLSTTRNRRQAQLSLRAPRAVVNVRLHFVSLSLVNSVFWYIAICKRVTFLIAQISLEISMWMRIFFICSTRKPVKCYWHTDQQVNYTFLLFRTAFMRS